MLQRLSLIAVIALIGSPAGADGHLRLDCSGLDPSKDGDADLAFLCLEDYQQRLEELEIKMSKLVDANSGEPFAPDIPDAIPSGMVAAFDLPSGCPQGWSPFADGQGRTIFGASFGLPDSLFRSDKLTQRKYRDHGGDEEVALSEAQMPRHRHDGPEGDYLMWWYKVGGGANHRVIDESNPGGSIANGYAEVRDTSDFSLQPAGQSAPHNNMPPYIALYFCKKD